MTPSIRHPIFVQVLSLGLLGGLVGFAIGVFKQELPEVVATYALAYGAVLLITFVIIVLIYIYGFILPIWMWGQSLERRVDALPEPSTGRRSSPRLRQRIFSTVNDIAGALEGWVAAVVLSALVVTLVLDYFKANLESFTQVGFHLDIFVVGTVLIISILPRIATLLYLEGSLRFVQYRFDKHVYLEGLGSRPLELWPASWLLAPVPIPRHTRG